VRRMIAPRRIRAERRIRVGRHLRTGPCIPAERRIRAPRQTQVGRSAKAVSRAQICRERVARHEVAEVADATSGVNASSGKVHPVFQKSVLRQNVAARPCSAKMSRHDRIPKLETGGHIGSQVRRVL
jgi:hypothetical protein